MGQKEILGSSVSFAIIKLPRSLISCAMSVQSTNRFKPWVEISIIFSAPGAAHLSALWLPDQVEESTEQPHQGKAHELIHAL
jgi:hypothetical protein